jgi:hypothetical protein
MQAHEVRGQRGHLVGGKSRDRLSECHGLPQLRTLAHQLHDGFVCTGVTEGRQQSIDRLLFERKQAGQGVSPNPTGQGLEEGK